MKSQYLIIILTLFSISIFNSCNDDLLDIEQKGVTSVDNFYETDNDATEAITAVYRSWREAGVTGWQMKNVLADETFTGGSYRGDNTDYQNISECSHTATNSHIEDYYSYLYRTIYRTNLILENFEQGESVVKDRCIAEAQFFRAYCYFELVTLWGTPPLVLNVLNPDEFEQANTEASLTWTQIETDFTEAINSGSLPSKVEMNDQETGIRVTKEAAISYLGKAYLYQEKYGEAATTLKEVINSGLYELVDDFGIFFHMEGDHNKEYILEDNRHLDLDNAWDQGGWWGILNNWKFGATLVAGSKALTNYPFMSTIGFGFFVPYKSLYDDFVAEEGVDGYRLNLTIKTWEQVKAMDVNVAASASFYGSESYFRWKFLPKTTEEHPFGGFYYYAGNYSNLPHMRFADVLLMAAEASLLSGDQGSADTYVNMVRSRAQLNNKSSVTIDDIKIERRLELAMEGCRFQDLSRWGDVATVLADKGVLLPTFRIDAEGTSYVDYAENENQYAGFTVGRNELLPFPQTEIDVNTSLNQNPNY